MDLLAVRTRRALDDARRVAQASSELILEAIEIRRCAERLCDRSRRVRRQAEDERARAASLSSRRNTSA